jgi:hypothetical protein
MRQAVQCVQLWGRRIFCKTGKRTADSEVSGSHFNCWRTTHRKSSPRISLTYLLKWTFAFPFRPKLCMHFLFLMSELNYPQESAVSPCFFVWPGFTPIQCMYSLQNWDSDEIRTVESYLHAAAVYSHATSSCCQLSTTLFQLLFQHTQPIGLIPKTGHSLHQFHRLWKIVIY